MRVTEEEFIQEIWKYYKEYGRELPWRGEEDPYKVLVSEIMLQQTQVSRVTPKYYQFLEVFPTFHDLAHAKLSDVLTIWKGLGYNRRGKGLHDIAKIVTKDFSGELPQDPEILEQFPSLGKATAHSVAVFSWNHPHTFIETNIRRVYIHFFFRDKEEVHDKEIFPLIKKTLDTKYPREWYYALMDYGAMLKTSVPNPNRKSAHYTKQSKFEGSRRQARSSILDAIRTSRGLTKASLDKKIKKDRILIQAIIQELQNEGFLVKRGTKYYIA